MIDDISTKVGLVVDVSTTLHPYREDHRDHDRRFGRRASRLCDRADRDGCRYGIIGGAPHRFAPLAELYRRTAAQAGHTGDDIKVSVAALGMVAPTKQKALDRFYPGWLAMNAEMAARRGWPAPDDEAFLAQAHAPGAYYVGDPDDVAERIAHLHGYMGHMRHFLQMDFGGLPQDTLLESITLLATEVKPRVERLLAKK